MISSYDPQFLQEFSTCASSVEVFTLPGPIAAHAFRPVSARWGRRSNLSPIGAAWGVEGAICVARPRIPENISLAQLAERYPRLKLHLGPACTQESATREPEALLFNRSGE
jgi:hypothetical protein